MQAVTLSQIEELSIIEEYLTDQPTFELSGSYASDLSIATAKILLQPIEDTLPNWGCFDDENLILGREGIERLSNDPYENLQPELVFTINWADSGPGVSWPEAYHITHIPGFNKYIVTASRDSTDAWHCTDHSIGFVDGNLSKIEAARILITQFWAYCFENYEMQWAYLFESGLAHSSDAHLWAREVYINAADEGCGP